jgi:colicin import membrane protein
LEHHQYNDIHLFSSERRKGIIGTSLLHIVVLLVLLIFGISAVKPPYKDSSNGILVNFGTDETGSGLIEPSPPPSTAETPVDLKDIQAKSRPARTAAKSAVEERLLTQNYDKEAPLIKKVDPEAEKRKKEQIEKERVKREELAVEKARIAAADAEKNRIEAEQKRSNDILNRTKNALANSKNSGTNSVSEGIAGGAGNQGDPNGSVNSQVRGKGSGTGTSGNGVSYSLEGRGFQSLPSPRYDYQGEGKVVVEVSVDRSGKVTEAVPGIKGSTTLDEYLLSAAKDAALKATFEAKPTASIKQKGTITYFFKLK